MEVKLFSGLQDYVGESKIKLSATKIDTLLRKVVKEYGGLEKEIYSDLEKKEVKSGINVMVNGRNIIYLNGLDTRLEDGDAVAIFPTVAGG